MSGLQILNNMFGYNTPLPDAPITRTHRIGVRDPRFARKEEPVRPPKPVKDPNKLKASERRILQIVQCNKGVTCVDVSKKTKWTLNHCSMILTALFRRGLIKRVKRTAPNIRFYVYYKKENDTA